MAFDLYYAGTQSLHAEEMLEKHECPRLLSYLNDQHRIKRRVGKNLKTFIDSGAFSAWSLGKEVDIDSYCNWLNEYDEFVEIAAELDHIPGRKGQPRTQKQNDEGGELSWKNYLYMCEKVENWEKILPVFHQGENWKYLHQMLEHQPKVPYIGLSTNKEVSQIRRNSWLVKCFEIIAKSSNPEVKTHAFGMTSLPALERFPFTSADSTGWILTGATGSVMSPYGNILVSSKKGHEASYIGNLSKSIRDRFNEYLAKYGFTFEEVASNHRHRIDVNLLYLEEWRHNYKYRPLKTKQNNLF